MLHRAKLMGDGITNLTIGRQAHDRGVAIYELDVAADFVPKPIHARRITFIGDPIGDFQNRR